MCLEAHNSILGFLGKLSRVCQSLLLRDRMLFVFAITGVFLPGTRFYVILMRVFTKTTFFLQNVNY